MGATVTIVGRLGRDGEVRQAGQSQVLTLSVGVTGKKKGNEQAPTEWYSAEVWGQRGQSLAQHCKKGQQIIVSGEFEIQRFTNQQGVPTIKPVINVQGFEFGAAPQGGQQQTQQAAPPPPKPATAPPVPQSNDLAALFASADEIPF
jgi:single-strand DNA-binding protein